MAWRRDPTTGEWEMVDADIPDPMTQSTTQQEPNPALRDMPSARPPSTERGFSAPDLWTMPVPSPSQRSERPPEYAVPPDNAGGYSDPDLDPIPLSPPGQGAYQNYDPTAYARWEQEVEARGNEVRETAVGCFEVDADNNIVSRAPTGYKVN